MKTQSSTVGPSCFLWFNDTILLCLLWAIWHLAAVVCSKGCSHTPLLLREHSGSKHSRWKPTTHEHLTIHQRASNINTNSHFFRSQIKILCHWDFAYFFIVMKLQGTCAMKQSRTSFHNHFFLHLHYLTILFWIFYFSIFVYFFCKWLKRFFFFFKSKQRIFQPNKLKCLIQQLQQSKNIFKTDFH